MAMLLLSPPRPALVAASNGTPTYDRGTENDALSRPKQPLNASPLRSSASSAVLSSPLTLNRRRGLTTVRIQISP
ncbi:hypothetical protein SNOG_04236 [Parastagonospora nodorum SN15]|uniref:Uncharacterized protein n=1 Tax=Phaeosphaeria nodorum (strain SN15 / ATCC MYA-4574 / FGSC 10173) TaxID=321614 RepID=Q0UVH8_PHANO|nr:hypothetical protein SNOG_04236 [Parastagonospora nodorum SN15]EAT87996.1 hypothetical protein SNOG_04236 [Parastagonospora nodorum SN15]